ncbi:heparan-alpha-glucosaminide N-acetyltransferase [Roseibium salinum]|uniref:Heparan-alpha-glucosaminide N-acetyltransferase n=1 Tax=Roseibium salinum TaxID=1604349 RepID=A0ABT3QXW6_9HYPH|nr:heparan-alpha-glucosaminide N-acetyltransferase [Roseibium sp. DSM 29163]MCX2721688.1 heparan-alpha-glucosaminide N-acetyltransferase [Roseibium sp. DSM 29163]
MRIDAMPSARLAVLDFARGFAVVTMAVYHLSWDLSWFGFVDWQVAQGIGWRTFAAAIAGSFLFLAGISLDLAHHKGIRWKAFLRRLAIIVAAAGAVSLATYFTFGDSFVRFGILHSIAASSLVALPFVRAQAWIAAAAAAFVLTLPLWARSFVFNGQLWLWTGLGTPDYGSVDYVPLTPWAGVTLAGLAVSKLFRTSGIWQRLSVFQLSDPFGRFTRLVGRHSLSIYLLHQPVLYGLVWSATLVTPELDRAERAFFRNCKVACQDSLGSPDICEAACTCTLAQLKADDLWTSLNEEPENQALLSRMRTAYTQCLADPETRPGTVN